jgi:hypothetical protein
MGYVRSSEVGALLTSVNMPTVVEPAAASPAGGIAAAIVNVGQNAMLNASTLAGTSAASALGLPDLTGLDAQEQVRDIP